MASVEDDRRWVIETYKTNEGRNPTPEELEGAVGKLQSGYPRDAFARELDRFGDVEGWVTRTYRELFGRAPNAQELATFSAAVRNGEASREDMRNYLAGKPEALLYEPTAPAPEPDKDAQAYLERILGDYGLGSLSGWAWEQIQGGSTPARVLQDLRQRPEYKQRFAGLEMRREAGYGAIDEATYISLERSYRQIMHAAGMPPEFYDSPDDYATLIGRDVSPSEWQTRVNEGYLAATQAVDEVREQLQGLYGIDVSQLAAYFLDPDRALPLLQRQFDAARMSGTAVRTGYGALGVDEAERLAALGVTEQQAEEGFGFLEDAQELWNALPGEGGAASISRADQQAAVFGGDAEIRQEIRRRQETRVSQGSGGQSFAVGNQGVSGLGRTRRT